jgi:hypothetical protein
MKGARPLNPLPYIDLNAMRGVDVRTVDPAALVDIQDITIDPKLPFMDRALDYLRQCGPNAYCFRCGDVTVKIGHSQTERTLSDCVEGFLQSL